MTTEPATDFQLDLARGRWDVEFFARRFLGVELHPGQRRFVEAYIQRARDGIRPRYWWVIVSAGNRAGKTLACAVIILHSCLYKIGLPPPDFSPDGLERWRKEPYYWFHFGIQQEIADLVYNDIVNLLSGIHPAQRGNGCPLADDLGGPTNVAAWDRKYQGDYRWIVFAPYLSGAEVHFRTTGERAIGSLGRNMHGISFDEVGFERNLDFIVNEVLHMRRLGTGGQLILISTPTEGFVEFADLWATGDPANPERKPGRVALRMSTRENVGYGLDPEVFNDMVADMPPELVPQNIDGQFIQAREAFFSASSVRGAFFDWLPERTPPLPAHTYVLGIDPALVFDSTWGVVLDLVVLPGDADIGLISACGVDIRRLRGKQTARSVIKLIRELYDAYDNPARGATCTIAIDTTGMGKVLYSLLRDEVPEAQIVNVEFGGAGKGKQKLLDDLRTMLDEGRLALPAEGLWWELRRQLLRYRLLDAKLRTDAVMALACAVQGIRRAGGGGSRSIPFEYHLAETYGEDGLAWAKRPFRRTEVKLNRG